MRTINDIIDAQGEFLCFEDFVMKYGNCVHRLEYSSLLHSIPSTWKIFLKITPPDQTATPKINILNVSDASRLVMNERLPYPKLEKWNVILGAEMGLKQFLKNFTNVRLTTIATKLRDFQYRLLHNLLPTNRDLVRWKIKDSFLCTFCHLHEETI